MIEIPIIYGKAVIYTILAVPAWIVLWALAAAFVEYPNQASWRTAVPVACLVLFVLLCALEVIVFV